MTSGYQIAPQWLVDIVSNLPEDRVTIEVDGAYQKMAYLLDKPCLLKVASPNLSAITWVTAVESNGFRTTMTMLPSPAGMIMAILQAGEDDPNTILYAVRQIS